MQSIKNFLSSDFYQRFLATNNSYSIVFYVCVLGPVLFFFFMMLTGLFSNCASDAEGAAVQPYEEQLYTTDLVTSGSNYHSDYTKNECLVAPAVTFDTSKTISKTLSNPEIQEERQIIPDEYLINLLTMAIPMITEESETLVEEEVFHRSVRHLSEEEIEQLAIAAFNATSQWESNSLRLDLAIGALIIAAYESNWQPDVLGDCWTMTGPQQRQGCNREERQNRNNYHACGMTQVLASDRMTAFHGYHRRPTCDELQDPVVALNYTATRLFNYHSECDDWCVAGYAGGGAKARAFESRFNLLMDRIQPELP